MGFSKWQGVLAVAVAAAAIGWLGAGAASAYVVGARPWPGGVIRYYNADPGMKTEVAAATKAWNTSGAHVHFIAVPRSRAQVIIVGWPNHTPAGPEAGFASLGWVPPGGLVPDPWGHIVRGAHVWLHPVNVATGLNSAAMTVATAHELGHILGLNHSTRCATMDATFVALCKSAPHLWQFICRPLQPDDVAGAVHLYGGRARQLGPQRYCSYFAVPRPATGLAASLAGPPGGYGVADSVRLSWHVPKGVRFTSSPTGTSIGFDRVSGAVGHCPAPGKGELALSEAKPGGIDHTTVSPDAPGRWCFTVEILDVYQRPSQAASIWVTVPGPPPTAAFNASQDQTNGLLYNFQDTSNVSTGARSYAWNFGDPGSGAANTSTQANPSHAFSAPGSYQVKETVTDSFGQSNAVTQTVYAANYPAPTAAFDDNCGQPGSCSLSVSNPFDVGFQDDSSSPDGAIVGWSWNFGDPASGTSNTDTSQYPYHAYSTPGAYTVTLTVTDDHGQQATTSQTVYIDP